MGKFKKFPERKSNKPTHIWVPEEYHGLTNQEKLKKAVSVCIVVLFTMTQEGGTRDGKAKALKIIEEIINELKIHFTKR